MKRKKLNKLGKIVLVFLILILIIFVLILKKSLKHDYKNYIEEAKKYTIKIDLPKVENKEIDEQLISWSKNSIKDFKENVKQEKNSKDIQYELLITTKKTKYNNYTRYYITKNVYSGKNHEEKEYKTINILNKTKEQINISYFLKDNKSLEKISKLSHLKVMHEIKKKDSPIDEELVKKGTRPNIINYENFEFKNDGLYILFKPYQASAWSVGEINIKFSYEEIGQLLKNIPKFKEVKKEVLERKERDLTKYKNKKLIAITFDDGPSPKTKHLLDELSKTDWKVTFFLVGNRVEEFKNIVKREFVEGHQVANHSYSHINFNHYSEFDVYNEITKTNDEIEKITGYRPKYLRPPYGNIRPNIREIANMDIILWNIDTVDWKNRNKEAVYKRIMENATDGSIVLLHDLYKTSVEGALMAMTELEKKGYSFVTVEEMVKIKNINLDKSKNHYRF